jgi:MEDS: MEthanogen/methylotroph, DcmR Sensory domain
VLASAVQERRMGSAVKASIGDDPIETDPLIRLGNAVLGLRRHVCAFFNSPDEQHGVLLPFIKDGIDSGEKAVHIIHPNRPVEHVGWLRSVGIDAAAMQQVGTLDWRDWANAHLQDGTFDPNRTRALIADIRQRSSQAGFPRTRFVAQMDWAVDAGVSTETLLEYEACANLVPLRDPVVCAYDLSRFSGDVVPPDEFLRERRGRHLSAPPPPLG